MTLVLTRGIKEALKIGDDVEVRVLGVKGDQVRLGIIAPKDVDIHRAETAHLHKKSDDTETDK